MTDIEQLWAIALALCPDNLVAESLLRTSLDYCNESTDVDRFQQKDRVRRLTSIMVSMVLSNPARFDAMPDSSLNRATPRRREDRKFVLQNFLRRLPQLDRVVMTLREFQGWDAEEVATLLGLTKNAVLERQFGTRLAIGKWMTGEGLSGELTVN